MSGIGIAFLASDGSNVDDTPIFFREHHWNDGPATEKDACQIGLNDFGPFLWRHFPGLFCDPGDTCIVDENIDRSKRLDRLLGCGFD